MKRGNPCKTKQEAQEAAITLLWEISKERDYAKDRKLIYVTFSLRIEEVADSFAQINAKPLTPFDIPVTSTQLEDSIIKEIDEETGEEIGGRAYIYKHDCPTYTPEWKKGDPIEWNTNYIPVALSPEEADPLNLTFPFRNMNPNGLICMVKADIHYCKPLRAVTLQEALTPEGAKVVQEYLYSYDSSVCGYFAEEDKEKYIRREVTKGDLFEIQDEELEAEPDKYSGWEDNVVFKESPSPAILSEATGLKITTAQTYASALEKILGDSLDYRERRAVMFTFDFHAPDRLLDYAFYEFMRTESYEHLKEILSHYADFGLSPNWEKTAFRLWQWDENYKKKIRITAVDWILSQYLCEDYSSIIGTPSYREISDHTGTPVSLILRASKVKRDI